MAPGSEAEDHYLGLRHRQHRCAVVRTSTFYEGPRLEKAAKRKKDKYLEACRERRRDFIPMAYSVDGLAGKEVRAAEKRLASLLASKWDSPYSEMACFVKTRMSLSIVRSISMLLRGCWSSTWKRRAPDDDVAARASVTSQRW